MRIICKHSGTTNKQTFSQKIRITDQKSRDYYQNEACRLLSQETFIMKPIHIRLPARLTAKDLHGKTVEFQCPNGYWGTGKFDVLASPEDKQTAIIQIIECCDGRTKKHPLNQKAIDCLSRTQDSSKSDFQLIMGK